MDTPLTRRQREIHEYLLAHADEPPPTLDELARGLGMRSRGSLHRHVQALVDAGLVEPMDGKKRGVRLAETTHERDDELPLLGRIAAGQPIAALPQPETLEVPTQLRRDQPCYVLEVDGDSMIDEGIFDGDWVVVEERDRADNGELVVALIDGEEATLKRIEQRPDKVVLHPANADHAPQEYAPERVRIQGVVVSQMRRYF
ncbi:transcriptional repressor LexA [Thiohalorhabdus methylotrophus]|uniref:LexA repressor n=1 Tax=Thiohalorhabdus methylotrophus TaxID=3242694 RepID=A0ABV4TUP9_9GAMM